MIRAFVVACAAIFALAAPASAQVDITYTPTCGKVVSPKSATGFSINGCDRTLTLKAPNGSLSTSTLLNALPAGRKAVEQGDGSDLGVTIPGGVARSLAARLADTLHVRDFDAKCDGTTDDAAAINAALASGRRLVRLPDASCRAASTIVVPRGVTLQGTGFAPGNPPNGTRIVCDLTVSPCVTTAGGPTNGQPALKGLSVDRTYVGTVPTTTIGIEIVDAYNVIVEDVMSHNHGVTWRLKANAATGLGLGAALTRVYSGRAYDTHIEIDSWAEARFSQSRFGMNGCGDVNSNTFVRYSGGASGTAGGPNTIKFQNTQFNQGCGTEVKYLAAFVNLAAPIPSIDAVEFDFDSIHVEGVEQALFVSDATWNVLSRSKITNSSFTANVPAFALNPATRVDDFSIINCTFAGPATLAPAGQMTGLRLIGNKFGGGLTLATTAGGSTVNVTGNVFSGNLTFTGSYGSLTVSGNSWTTGGLVNNATGNWLVMDAVYGIQRPGHVDTRTAVFNAVLDGDGRAIIPHNIADAWKRATISTAVITTASANEAAFVHSVTNAYTVIDNFNIQVYLGSAFAGRKLRVTAQFTESADPNW